MKRSNTSDQSQSKKPCLSIIQTTHFIEYGRLNNAKAALLEILPSYPNARVYQIEKIPKKNESRGITFCTAPFDHICNKYIVDIEECRGLFTNVAEYYFGDKPCPLVIDADWYNPVAISHKSLFDTVSRMVDALIIFISISLKHATQHITRDDVCVEQACSVDGRKASFHIKIHKLVFFSMGEDMKDFVFYFCSWLYQNRQGLPDIFFYQTIEVQRVIKNYTGNADDNNIINTIKTMAENQWKTGSCLQYASCGIDMAIYSRGRAFRICGVCKPNRPNEKPRFLRPCMVTNWWSMRLNGTYLDESVLNEEVPSKMFRRVWAGVSLLMFPSPPAPSIFIPLPTGQKQSKKTIRPLQNDNEWKWITDHRLYPSPVKLAYLHDDVKGNGKAFLFHSNVNVSYILNPSTRHHHELYRMRLAALERMKESGILKNDQGKLIQYTSERATCEKEKNRIIGDVSICAVNPKTIKMMFIANNVTLNPNFRITNIKGNTLCLGDITRKTPVFCPKHESSQSNHRPSAFVGVDTNGRRFLSCSVCGGPGKSIFETLWDHADHDDWNDLQQQLGLNVVQILDEPYFELKHLLYDRVNKGKGVDRTLPTYDLSSISYRRGGLMGLDRCVGADHLRSCKCGGGPSKYVPPTLSVVMHHEDVEVNKVSNRIFVGISPMGSGKTTLLKKLTNEVNIIMEKIGSTKSLRQPTILSISPRTRLAEYTGRMLDLVVYTDMEGMYRRQTRGKKTTRDELLCAQDRLSICINSLKRLAKRAKDDGYDVVIMDEFATTAMSLVSDLMLPHARQTWEVLMAIMQRARLLILLAADGNMYTVKTLLPFVNWDRPTNITITINTGGVGGISNHQLYMSDDIYAVCRALKMNIQAGKSVYIPTNQNRFAKNLYDICKNCLGLGDDEIVLFNKDTTELLWHEMIDNPKARLGYDGQRTRVRVFIATPAFGVGFSVPGGIFDITVAFFFIFPSTVPITVQQLARVRGVNDKEIICYYQSGSSKRSSQGGERLNIERAVNAYDEIMARANPEFATLSNSSLRDYAITQKVLVKQSIWDAAGMFAEAAGRATGVSPKLLHNWVCNRRLPRLTNVEMKMIYNKSVQINGLNPPTTHDEMISLWAKQTRKEDLAPSDADFVKIFMALPIPTGLLYDYERTPAFVRTLDNIWRAMEVLAHEKKDSLLLMDYKRRDTSQGVSTVSERERNYQQYLIYDAWASLTSPSLADQYDDITDLGHGAMLFNYVIDKAIEFADDDVIIFDIRLFNDQVRRIVKTLQESTLRAFGMNDTDHGAWFNQKDLSKMCHSNGKGAIKTYAKILRKGFRQFFNMSNVSVKVAKVLTNDVVRVKIENFNRLVSFACIRRIAVTCEHVVCLSQRDYAVYGIYRTCPALSDIILSDDDISRLRGIEM